MNSEGSMSNITHYLPYHQLVLLAVPEPCASNNIPTIFFWRRRYLNLEISQSVFTCYHFLVDDVCSGARYCICGLVPNQ
uniref:Bm13435, isoform c n=1 Tax=Brugia malayi TaxID=6279 RepID=A0A1I9G1R8_BRUMA|nr:Bm13435, isoform c [Brugia malayi]